MLKQSLLVGLAMTLAACDPGASSGEGAAKVSVRGLTAAAIRNLVVTAQPANVSKTLAYDSVNNVFTGSMLLPAGTQTLTAAGYSWNPDDGVVASGTGSVTVQPESTLAVTLVIYDQTLPDTRPDIAPIIRSVTASKATLVINEPITVSVDAVDLDGTAMSYAWSSDCASSTFANPAASTTTWVSPQAAACTLQVQVISGPATVRSSVMVLVFPPAGEGQTGGINITGEYVPRPRVEYLAMSGAEIGAIYMYRWHPSANFPAIHEGQTYDLQMAASFYTAYGTINAGMEIDCGGTLELVYRDCPVNPGSGVMCTVSYRWTAPQAGTICKLTGTASNSGIVDNFPAGLIVR